MTDYWCCLFATLNWADGTAEGIWRLLMALSPAAHLRALAGQQVVINGFAPVVKLPVIVEPDIQLARFKRNVAP